MFLLRSAFWLTIAFMLIRPGVDVRDAASELSATAMAQGSAYVSEQIDTIACESIQCIGGKALATAALHSTTQAGQPMHVSPASPSVPLPRPRPDRLG